MRTINTKFTHTDTAFKMSTWIECLLPIVVVFRTRVQRQTMDQISVSITPSWPFLSAFGYSITTVIIAPVQCETN